MKKSNGAASKWLRIFVALISLVIALNGRNAPAQTMTALHDFSPGTNDGSQPLYVHLIQATDGNFYGTTEGGGISNAGTVFKITSTGALTILYSFRSSVVNDGEFPQGGVVQGTDGNFYGTTYEGGSNSWGTVYKMTPAGVLTNIHIFQGRAAGEGIWPFAPLVQSTDGLFYGTTSAGGSNGYGSVFKIDSSGNLTTIWSFTNGLDGSDPYAGLFQGSDGYFYGTAHYGGTSNMGTVFKVASVGGLIPLHQFGDTAIDGEYPLGGLVQGYTGNYYGATYGGGSNGYGVVFSMTSNGVLTNLYHFGAFAYDGLNPSSALVQGSDSYLYGTTYLGGTNGNAGTLFKIGPEGGLTYVHDFDGFIGDGVYPDAPPVEGYDGNYYGTTRQGGTNEIGMVYKLTMSASPNPNEPNITDNGSDNGNPNNPTNNVNVSFASVAGETYQLQFADSLPTLTWSNVPGGAVTNSIGGPLTISNILTTNARQRFYRVQIRP